MKEQPAIDGNSSEHEPQKDWPAIGFVLARMLLGLLLWCLVLFLLSGISNAAVDAGFTLAVGWFRFLWARLSAATVDGNAVLTGGCLVLVVVGLVKFTRRRVVYREICVVVLVFVSGTAFTAMVRNAVWLGRHDRSLTQGNRRVVARSQAKNNLKQLGLAMHNYHEVHGGFPTGGAFDESGRGLHSWTTALLPHFEPSASADVLADIQRNRPWDAPVNRWIMQQPFSELLEPNMPKETWIDERGFAATHYAANSWLMGPNASLAIRNIKDGTTNTLMIGQIRDQIPAWGNPVNWRDPTRKLNSAGAFGSLHAGVVQFVLADGSVRAISENIDPRVMRAIASPAGGEPVGAF